MSGSLIDPALFEQLKAKIEEDSKVRQDLTEIVEELSQQVAFVQGLLSRIHSTPRSQCEFSMGGLVTLESIPLHGSPSDGDLCRSDFPQAGR